MEPNPLLKQLGLKDNDRAVIIHADDVGMCQSGLAAYVDLVDFGLLSSASTMVPCPWFPATAAYCRENAAKVDMGVHITLNSEWSPMRWSPLSTADPASGLLDGAGYFHEDPAVMYERVDLEAAQREMAAQVERALAAGIDVTHIDTHMFAVATPELFNAYVQVALQYRVPPLLVRGQAGDLYYLEQGETPIEAPDEMAQYMRMLQAQGIPVLDYLYLTPLDVVGGRVAQIQRLLKVLPPGITYLIIHPSKDTPEIRALTTDWAARVADYEVFGSEEMRQIFKDAAIHVIGWRVLRDLMRQAV